MEADLGLGMFVHWNWMFGLNINELNGNIVIVLFDGEYVGIEESWKVPK